MSLQNVEVEADVSSNVVQGQALWNAPDTTKTHRHSAAPTLNARVVEIIAKPGKVELLEEYIRGEVMEFLNRQRGFAGAMILNSHQEQRLILVVSFWTTKRTSEENCWEKSRVVRQTAGFLVDVCSRVQTYQAGFAGTSAAEHQFASGWKLQAEVQE